MTYKIIRFYREYDHPNNLSIIKTGLTVKQAQEHCQSEHSHVEGVWFDGYIKE